MAGWGMKSKLWNKVSSRWVTMVLVARRPDCRAWGDWEMKRGTAMHRAPQSGGGRQGEQTGWRAGRRAAGVLRCPYLPGHPPLGKPHTSGTRHAGPASAHCSPGAVGSGAVPS